MGFQPGNKLGGRTSEATKELRDVLKTVGEVKGKTFLRHFVERAYAEDSVAIALAKKILPDLSNELGSAQKVMQLIVDSKDLPKGSLIPGEDESKASPIPD